MRQSDRAKARPQSPADEREEKEIIPLARFMRRACWEKTNAKGRACFEIQVDNDAKRGNEEEQSHRAPAAAVHGAMRKKSNDSKNRIDNSDRSSPPGWRRIGGESFREFPVRILEHVSELQVKWRLSRPQRGNVVL